MRLAPDPTSRYDQQVGASAYPQRSFSANIFTPKYVDSFTLASLTNISYQMDLEWMLGPCFFSCVEDKTGQWMLNLHLSYKPHSSWKIIFCSGGLPRQSICLKKFRALTDTGGVWCKGVIIQRKYLPSGLPVLFQSLLRTKGDVTGASVHAPR